MSLTAASQNSIHQKITSISRKKTVALTTIGVIFLGLLWFLGFGTTENP
jgi:hypothetical protein